MNNYQFSEKSNFLYSNLHVEGQGKLKQYDFLNWNNNFITKLISKIFQSKFVEVTVKINNQERIYVINRDAFSKFLDSQQRSDWISNRVWATNIIDQMRKSKSKELIKVNLNENKSTSPDFSLLRKKSEQSVVTKEKYVPPKNIINDQLVSTAKDAVNYRSLQPIIKDKGDRAISPLTLAKNTLSDRPSPLDKGLQPSITSKDVKPKASELQGNELINLLNSVFTVDKAADLKISYNRILQNFNSEIIEKKYKGVKQTTVEDVYENDQVLNKLTEIYLKRMMRKVSTLNTDLKELEPAFKLTALMLAIKVSSENAIWNQDFLTFVSLDLKKINEMEKTFLAIIDSDIQLSDEDLNSLV